MSVFEMAMQYYPRLWDDKRLNALLEAGKLTEIEVTEIRLHYKNDKSDRV